AQQVIAKYMTYYRIITEMAIYDARLVPTAASNPEHATQLAHERELMDAVTQARPSLQVSRPNLRNLGIRSVAPILRGSRIEGAIVVDISIHDVEETLAAIDRRLTTIMGAMMALVAAALYLLLRGGILLRLNRLM